ncbi:hypothetical protein, partial [Endozoicomonas sp. SESOKO1]|uniref:hypothetical protein n=1 Tax=Endozoicomonas sp. SESOKO1 TaxID=2828742 RepID=UPI0021477CCE
KNRDQCFSSMSLMALGYKDEEFKQDGLDCLILSGSGDKENVETVGCSAYGSPNDSILIFMPKLGDDEARRIHAAIEKKEDISFNVMRTEIKTKFKLDDPDGFISMSNNYCKNG